MDGFRLFVGGEAGRAGSAPRFLRIDPGRIWPLGRQCPWITLAWRARISYGFRPRSAAWDASLSSLFASLSNRRRSTMAAKKSGKPQPTDTLKHLAPELAGSREIAEKQAETILNDLVRKYCKSPKKGIRL